MKMRTHIITIVAALTGLLFFSGATLAAQGPPDGGGSGEPPDYGDLIILYRDVNGVPIPSPEVQVEDPETGLLVEMSHPTRRAMPAR